MQYYFEFCKFTCKWFGICAWCHEFSLYEIKWKTPCNSCKYKNDINRCYDCDLGDLDTGLFVPFESGLDE